MSFLELHTQTHERESEAEIASRGLQFNSTLENNENNFQKHTSRVRERKGDERKKPEKHKLCKRSNIMYLAR
jgi:hypothetical protein